MENYPWQAPSQWCSAYEKVEEKELRDKDAKCEPKKQSYYLENLSFIQTRNLHNIF